MSQQITDEVVAKVADLIKIRIDNLSEYADKLQHVLDSASVLQELDTTSTDILSHPTGLTTIGEEDRAIPGLTTSEALRNAQENGRVALDYIKVTKVISE